jgi:hypothetical protein
MIYEELCGKVTSAAMVALKASKPGLAEKLYEGALIMELKQRGHDVSVQTLIFVCNRSYP